MYQWLTWIHQVWRESYAPLFACSCKICERAMLHRDVGDTVRPNDTNYVVPSHPASYPQRGQHRTALGNTIRLEEAVYEEEEEEEEEDEEAAEGDEGSTRTTPDTGNATTLSSESSEIHLQQTTQTITGREGVGVET